MKIITGEVLKLEFPVGEHNVIFDGGGDILDYKINVEKPNNMIYIDISLISELSHSSGIPKIQSVKNESENFLSIIGIISGIIEFAVMLSHSFAL